MVAGKKDKRRCNCGVGSKISAVVGLMGWVADLLCCRSVIVVV